MRTPQRSNTHPHYCGRRRAIVSFELRPNIDARKTRAFASGGSPSWRGLDTTPTMTAPVRLGHIVTVGQRSVQLHARVDAIW